MMETEVRNFNTTANISAYRGDFTELFAQGYEFVSETNKVSFH